MQIVEQKNLAFPEIKVIKFSRFKDERGYFTEIYRQSDFQNIEALKDVRFTQCNEARSNANVMRGFHFQWEPPMAKMVRLIQGNLIDFMLDIRLGSPNFGKIIAYQITANINNDYDQWLFIPPGFAHGTLLLEPSLIEYFCTGHYNPECEAGISPLADDIDFSLCDKKLTHQFFESKRNFTLSIKDKLSYTVLQWLNSGKAEYVKY